MSEMTAVATAAVEAPTLTILTVILPKHVKFIRRQIQLVERLNPGFAWQMLVVDNSTTEQSAVTLDDPRCTVVAGVPPDLTIPYEARGSYHHAAALNRAIRGVRTRWLLVLDPDLFVLYPNWLPEIIAHCRRRDLALFGTRWHPQWYNKYRFFPSIHLMLVDLDKIGPDRLDMTPAILTRRAWSKRHADQDARITAAVSSGAWRKGGLRHRFYRARWKIADLGYRALPIVFSRNMIGTACDTGYKVWEDFVRTGRYSADTLQPVADIATQFKKPDFLRTARGRIVDRLMPRRYRFLPEPGTYVPAAEAPGFAGEEFALIRGENFMWRGAPFAIHLRHNVRDEVAKRTDGDKVWEAMETVLARAETAPAQVLAGNGTARSAARRRPRKSADAAPAPPAPPAA